MVALAAQANAHAIVGWAELDHVDALDRQDRLEVLDRAFLFDHQHDDRVLVALGQLDHSADRCASSIVAVCPDAARHLGLGDANALLGILGTAHVGKQQVLDTGGHSAHGDVLLRRALHLDQTREVWIQLDGAAKVV